MAITTLPGTFIKSGSIPVTALGGGVVSSSVQLVASLPAGVVSSSTQVQPLLPNGTVSSSAQYPGWVTSSAQIDYNSIQNKLSGVVSSSAQVTPLLPGGTVSSSTQFRTLTDPFSGSFTGSFTGIYTGSAFVNTGSITLYTGSVRLGYSASTNTQEAPLIIDTAQISTNRAIMLTKGPFTGSYYGYIEMVGGSPPLVIRSSGDLGLYTQGANSLVLTYANNVSSIVSSFDIRLRSSNSARTIGTRNQANDRDNLIITDSGDVTITGSLLVKGATGISGSAFTGSILSPGVVSSSAQYPGWVTSSTQIDYNSIQNKLSGVISSSTQFNALTGTSASFAATASYVNTLLQTVSASGNIAAGTNLVSNNSIGDEGGEILLAKPQTNTGIAGTGVTIDIFQNKLRFFEQGGSARGFFVDITSGSTSVGTNLQAAASAVSTYTNATDNRVITSTGAGGINAESTLTYDGTVLSISTNGAKFLQGGDDSALYDVNVANTLGIHGQQDSTVGAIKLGSSGQVIYSNATGVGIGTITPGALLHVQGTVSSSGFIGPHTGSILSAGVVSASAQYPGWVTASSQIDYNSITNKLSGVYSSSTQTVASLSGQAVTFSGSQFSGIVSGSGLQYRLVVPVGTNYYAT
jgi:hypothetical protein